MTFPRDFKDRVVQFPGRRRLTPVPGQPNVYDVTREEGTVTEPGIDFAKTWMQAIEDEFGSVDTRLNLLENERGVFDNVSISNTGWGSAVGVKPYNFYKDIPITGLASSDTVDVNVTFGSLSVAITAGLSGVTEANVGFVRILAVNVPTGYLTADIVVNKKLGV